MALWLCPVSVCWEVMLNFLKISEKSRLFDCFWHVDSAGSSRIYRCTMNHTTSRMITEVAMAMTSHIAAIVGKGVSLRGFTVSQDHCHDSKLSLSNHIKPYQSISIHQTPSNAFKVHGPWRSRFRNPFVTGVLDLKHFDHWKVEPDLISLNTASATWLDDRLQVQSNR